MVWDILEETEDVTAKKEDPVNKAGQTADEKAADTSRDIEENLPEKTENVQGSQSIAHSL